MVKTRTVKELAPNPNNPRKISEAKLLQLQKALAEFGDLSGFVYNRKTKHIISGHQRAKVFDEASEIEIDKKYKKPTGTGTVAEGFVILHGERFRYREVSWDEPKEKAATIAANQSAGEWDTDLLIGFLDEIEDFGMDADLTMFTKEEREKLKPKKTSKHDELDEKPTRDKKKSRSASDSIQGTNLVFDGETKKEFDELLEIYQLKFGLVSVSDTVLQVMREFKWSLDESTENVTPLKTKIRKK